MTDLSPEYLTLDGVDFIKLRRLEKLARTAQQRQRDILFIMEDVHDQHNLAAIARSCDAFGIQNIAFTMENDELFNPTQISNVTSSGASKWLDYRIFENGTEAAFATLHAEGWHIMATYVGESVESHDLYGIDIPKIEKLALLVGNEHAGISPKAVELADSFVKIPMHGMVQSFNVSVAAAICLAEITRQRHASPINFFIPEHEALTLTQDFIKRSLGSHPLQYQARQEYLNKRNAD